jgi:ion channel POLLUX/CASTOR
MLSRLIDRLFLLVELRLLPGLTQRLVLIGGVIAALAMSGGLAVWWLAPLPEESVGEAIWWAFLHLSDSGYLGDDSGVFRRAVAATLTVSGLVVFVGLLVAVMTQWLTQRIVQFERGVTRVPFENHVLILGWSNRTLPILRELLESTDRVQQMLAERGARRLRIVILDDAVDHAMQQALRDGLGPLYDARRVLLRYGSPLRTEHLERVNFAAAATVILPAVAAEDAAQVSSDAQVIKTLMAAKDAVGDRVPSAMPLIVAELFDPSKDSIAEAVYPGPLELLATERFLAQLVAQNIRHTGLSHVYRDLLTHADGDEVYAPPAGTLSGVSFAEARRRLPTGILLGTVAGTHRSASVLCPPADHVIEPSARLIVLAKSLAHCTVAPSPRALVAGASDDAPDDPEPRPPRRVLILGWGRKVPALISELDRIGSERCEVVVASALAVAPREQAVRRIAGALRHTEVWQREAEFTSRADLERLEPWTYEDIVVAASDWIDDPVEADARAVLAYLMLQQVLLGAERPPDVLVELLTEDSAPMLRSVQHEVIVGPSLISHMLANVALRRELSPVFGDIFTPGGTEVGFASLQSYGLEAGALSFDAISDAVARFGDIALGVSFAARASEPGGGMRLNPDRATPLQLTPADRLIVLACEPSVPG